MKVYDYNNFCSVDKSKKCTSGSVVEYRLAKARVAGSNPVSCLSFARNFNFKQVLEREHLHEWLSGGVSPCQGEGRGFESRLVLKFHKKLQFHTGSRKRALCTSGSVVEYRLAKARVAGSNPVSCFFYF